MKRTFVAINTKEESPTKAGWYNTDKGRLYWTSLTEAQREIISWCRLDKKAVSIGMGIAQFRERMLDEFYRYVTKSIITPKKIEKYEFVYQRFGEFKKYVQCAKN